MWSSPISAARLNRATRVTGIRLGPCLPAPHAADADGGGGGQGPAATAQPPRRVSPDARESPAGTAKVPCGRHVVAYGSSRFSTPWPAYPTPVGHDQVLIQQRAQTPRHSDCQPHQRQHGHSVERFTIRLYFNCLGSTPKRTAMSFQGRPVISLRAVSLTEDSETSGDSEAPSEHPGRT
jgi:hypothetical protein